MAVIALLAAAAITIVYWDHMRGIAAWWDYALLVFGIWLAILVVRKGRTVENNEFWRDGHPTITAISVGPLNLMEYVQVQRHMRDCAECKRGWTLLTGQEWVVRPELKRES